MAFRFQLSLISEEVPRTDPVLQPLIGPPPVVIVLAGRQHSSKRCSDERRDNCIRSAFVKIADHGVRHRIRLRVRCLASDGSFCVLLILANALDLLGSYW